MPVRAGPECAPRADSSACYRWAAPEDPLTFSVAAPPRQGTVSIARTGARTARATYVPEPGFAGPDEFSYVARDARALESPPARVRVVVRAPAAPAPAATPAPVATPAPSAIGAAPAAPAAVAYARLRACRGRAFLHLRLRARSRVRIAVRAPVLRRLRPGCSPEGRTGSAWAGCARGGR